MSVTNYDPVCGVSVEPGAEADRVTYAGTTYPFCSEDCARAFRRAPERYVSSIDGLKPGDRVSIAEAEREHRPRE